MVEILSGGATGHVSVRDQTPTKARRIRTQVDEVPSATVASMVRADKRSWSRKPAAEKLLLASFQSRVVAKDATVDEKEKDGQTMAILSKKLYAIGSQLNVLVATAMEEINDEGLRDDPFLWESLMELSTNVYEAGTELELGYTNN